MEPTSTQTTERTAALPYALIDPNYNEGDEVVLSTVAANREAAVDLAVRSKEVSLWSGFSEHPLPAGTLGNLQSLEMYGFRIAEIAIEIIT